MKERLVDKVNDIVSVLFGQIQTNFVVEHPEDFSHGDYSTNIALTLSKQLGRSPREIAGEIAKSLEAENIGGVEKVEVAGAGFINFYLSKDFFSSSLKEILEKGKEFGRGEKQKSKKVIFEYTDPNPFKQFHIGHLMSNAIGEALSRLAENQGAEVKRICYGSDIGLHVAKTIWGMIENKAAFPHDEDCLKDKAKFLGDAYVYGTLKYEEDAQTKKEITEINKKLFALVGGDKTESELHIYFDKGRKWSIEHFEEIYKKLDSHFDRYLFESEMIERGKNIVSENTGKIFEESEGAIIFKGEDHGLHTRVFITSEGLPTYEAKELALFERKVVDFPHDLSITITATEQNDYFRVLKKVFEMLKPVDAKKFIHISHGMLRFAEGKMSSRKGNIITGESLIEEMEEAVKEKIKEKDLSENEKKEIAKKVAIAAIKFSILRQSPGKDIIFDKEKSLSFEGDSGPYLQYAFVRASSILNKADEEKIDLALTVPLSWKTSDVEKLLYQFPEITKRSSEEKAPQILVEYLISLSSRFNAFYAEGRIVDKEDGASPYKLAITKAVSIVLEEGLYLLGIGSLARM